MTKALVTRTMAGRLIFLAMILASAASAAPTLTLGTLAPDGTTYHRSLVEMREKWRQAPGGGANLRIYGGGKMGGESKMVSQMRLGALDAALLTAAGLSDIDKAVSGLQSMPMMFRSLDELDYVSQKMQPKLEARLERQGFLVLYWTDAGWIRFFSKQPMHSPDDMRRMKLFTWAGDPAYVEIWKATGFQPVALETADIVPMLDTGLINVVSMPPLAALASQIHQRTPHMLELNWAPMIGALVVRKASWERVPKASRETLVKAALEAGRRNREHGRAENQKAVEAMRAKGLTVHPVSPELEAEWQKATEGAYPLIRSSVVPEDVFDEVKRLLEEFRAAGGSSNTRPSP